MDSDEALIARAIGQRDRHAFDELVRRHQSRVRRWTRRLCHGDADAGDDLAQDTFLKAYRSLHGYRGEARFTTWLYAIAWRLAAARRRLASERWDRADVPELAGECDQPDARLDLDGALARLTEAQQLAIRLSFEAGLTHEEVAQVMDIPLGTAKTHLLRGKRTLRKLLASWQEKTA